MVASAGPTRLPPLGGGRRICEVWSWNFDAEFSELLAAAAACGDCAVLGLDTEFPGFLHEEPALASRAVRYQSLRANVNQLQPIQLGMAVAGEDGALYGVWNFNLLFDVAVELHTEASILFLSAAGVDFPRHATEGIDPVLVGRRLAASPLVGRNGSRPRWVTFAGWYDFGYLLKLIRRWPLPQDVVDFDTVLAAFFPRRHELRDALPRGSLDSLARDFGVKRYGQPHTAGSDALATLELFLQVESSGTAELMAGANGINGAILKGVNVGLLHPAQPAQPAPASQARRWDALLSPPEGWQDQAQDFFNGGVWDRIASAVTPQGQQMPTAQVLQVQPLPPSLMQTGLPLQSLQPLQLQPLQLQPLQPMQLRSMQLQPLQLQQPLAQPLAQRLLQAAQLPPQPLLSAQLLHSMVADHAFRDWFTVEMPPGAWAVPLPSQWNMASRHGMGGMGQNVGAVGLPWMTMEHMPDLAAVPAG